MNSPMLSGPDAPLMLQNIPRPGGRCAGWRPTAGR